jgi:gamma-glutamyl hydrolase
MGYENMAIYAADDPDNVLSTIEVHNVSLPLDFLGKQPQDAKMFSDIGELATAFEKLPITYNSHTNGIYPDKFVIDAALGSMFTVTSVSYVPGTNEAFVATMESEQYPFFGTQFHPEKTTTMFNDDSEVNHSVLSEQLNRAFADKFVNLARRNPNGVDKDFATVQKMLVENYPHVVTDGYFGDVYVFN